MLGLLLCSGILIMITALLRVGFLHTSRQVGQISNWGSREVMVAAVVVNMPMIAPSTFSAILIDSTADSFESGQEKLLAARTFRARPL